MVAGLKGGVGSASLVLPDGTTIAALVVVNAIGSPVDLRTGELLAGRLLAPGDADDLRPPSDAELAALRPAATRRHPRQGAPLGGDGTAADAAAVQNTTIGVVATDAALTKAQCTKLAGVGHDGLARSLEPVHTMFDGDTLFGLSTATAAEPDPFAFHDILCAAADVVDPGGGPGGAGRALGEHARRNLARLPGSGAGRPEDVVTFAAVVPPSLTWPAGPTDRRLVGAGRVCTRGASFPTTAQWSRPRRSGRPRWPPPPWTPRVAVRGRTARLSTGVRRAVLAEITERIARAARRADRAAGAGDRQAAGWTARSRSTGRS